ncbi:hypothetical protein FN846DRAFT_924072 [Sphaerosporella brunnea]|uniref:Fibronectin type-III domain-containing protein n=1 Tax=Sphaerosporella brunnea TaxID=1250544 RepID=A0A5J5EBZ4_9PEZI|nr:hypothetical protein FN846DRAFT_924072 [Sphaerosporella brunnea]
MVVVAVATICALVWMCYRVTSLLNIPIPMLVKILGLDLPAPPRVSLHGVSADTITLHWSLPEKAGTVAKHIIQINGIDVGESEKRGETSVTVTGLNPDQRYNVRVIATNAQNFQAPGQLIRLKTFPASQPANETINGLLKGDSSDDAPSVHSVLEVSPSPHNYFGHHNQQSSQGPHHGSRKSARERRSSPASVDQIHTSQNYSTSVQEDQHTVESLTRDLDAVRREIQEAEAQLVHTEEEFKATEIVLRTELDTLKDKRNEEDAARQRIRAETKLLEESRRSAEAARTRTEKALKAKEYEIKKMQDDLSRWDEEKITAVEKVEEFASAAQESKENAGATEKELSNDIEETQRQIAEMEEEIRSLVAALKNLETQKEQLKANEHQEAQKAKDDNEKESIWRERQRNLEMRYVTVYNAFQAAEIESIRSRDVLTSFQGRRESGSGADCLQKRPKQRRHRNRKSRTQTGSSSLSVFQMPESVFRDGMAFNNAQVQHISPQFSNSSPSSPFFNIANGTVTGPVEIPRPASGPTMDPCTDSDNYINSTPMSPTANSLLPSNLFTFDDAPPRLGIKASDDDIDLKHSPFDTMSAVAPQSPISSGSVSTSPRSSFNHIPLFSGLSPAGRGSVHHLDNPERTASTISPIGSNRPLMAPSGEVEGTNPSKSSSRRFVTLFSNSFPRQRGKTVGFERAPPMVGQLRPSESHSFPKNEPPGLDPIGTRRRSGSHGSWSSSLDFLHGRAKALGRTNSDHSRRSATLNQFNPSFDPIDPNRLFDQPASPRPSSIASFDNSLPAPSSDASIAFGWPSADLANSFHNRLGIGSGSHWGDFYNVRMSNSRPNSRPISPNANASTSSLSFYPSHGYLASTNTGTGRPLTPRLNPTAPTFQSRMSTPARTRSNEEDNKRDRDSLSINTDVSAISGTSLENVSTKDSILSRFSLSRKGSNAKFNISWGRGRKKDSVDDELEEEASQVSMVASSSKGGGLWSAWRKDGDLESEDEEGKGRLTPLGKESSAWLKGSQSGFFGAIGRTSRKCEIVEDENDKLGDKEKVKDDSIEKKESAEKKGMGIFRRKADKDREKQELADLNFE